MARNFVSGNPDNIDHGNPSVLDLTGDEIALSLWARTSTSGAEQKIFSKWMSGQFSYLISILSGGNAQFVINDGSNALAIGSTDVTDGEWHHVVGTYDGALVNLYIDGVEEDSTANTGALNSSTSSVILGTGSGGTEQPYNGDLGHAAIWNVGLSASEAASLAASVSPLRIRRDSIVFYAPFNGQSPEADVIGGNTGTVNGTTVTEEPPIPNSIVAP